MQTVRVFWTTHNDGRGPAEEPRPERGLEHGAEIAHDDLAGDGARLVAREEEHDVGHVLGLAGLGLHVGVHRHGADHVLVERRGVHPGGHGRDDVAGADGVAADAGDLEAQRGVLGHTDDGGLGRDVGRAAAAALAGDGCHVDDGGAAGHALGRGAHAAHGALLVGLDDAVEVLVGVAVDGLEAGLEHARVVDQDVDLAVLLDRGGHQVLGVLGLGDVRGDDVGLAAGLGDLGGDLLERGGATGAHDDLGALRGEELGDGGADAGVCAGDDGDLVCETVHGNPFSAWLAGACVGQRSVERKGLGRAFGVG